jgi:2-polyprenyl-3-methyl-5-hydroxy-6-metoxy-1,4-benzoquinol methylase
MKEKVVHASDVKPDFTEVKKAWSKLLSDYYDNDGELKEKYVENVNCPHCNKNEIYNEFKLNGFNHVNCKNCDSVYVNPRLRDEYIDKLYTDSYYSEMFTKSMIPFFDKRKKLLGQNKYNQILNYSVKKGSVLDIGCGVGELIDVFKDNGWDSDVVELNPAAINWLEEKGHNVNKVHFADYNTEKKYDVVMAWNVIEHVLDPKEFVKKAFDLLKPGGIFISEVPHGNSLLIDYCRNTKKDPLRILQGEQHIMLYSKNAYEELHLKAGFEKIFVKTNGLDYGTILNLNNVKVDPDLILDIQSLIDSKNYGDLMRGFWIKN